MFLSAVVDEYRGYLKSTVSRSCIFKISIDKKAEGMIPPHKSFKQ